MALLDHHDRYGMVSVCLHWGLAGSMLLAWLSGQLAEDGGPFALHVSFGLLALAFALALVVWRPFVPGPAPVAESPPERFLARIVHAGLLAVAIAAPLSGILALESEGRPLRFFGIELSAGGGAQDGGLTSVSGPLAAFEEEEEERDRPFGKGGEDEEGEEGAGDIAEEAHELLAVPLFLLLLGLHVAGVAKHHLIDGVPVLRRMLGRPALPAADRATEGGGPQAGA